MDFADKKIPDTNTDLNVTVAPLIANAAWSAGDSSKMDKAITFMQSPEKAWYTAVSATMHSQQAPAMLHINSARDTLCDELGESKTMAYPSATAQYALSSQDRQDSDG